MMRSRVHCRYHCRGSVGGCYYSCHFLRVPSFITPSEGGGEALVLFVVNTHGVASIRN